MSDSPDGNNKFLTRMLSGGKKPAGDRKELERLEPIHEVEEPFDDQEESKGLAHEVGVPPDDGKKSAVLLRRLTSFASFRKPAIDRQKSEKLELVHEEGSPPAEEKKLEKLKLNWLNEEDEKQAQEWRSSRQGLNERIPARVQEIEARDKSWLEGIEKEYGYPDQDSKGEVVVGAIPGKNELYDGHQPEPKTPSVASTNLFSRFMAKKAKMAKARAEVQLGRLRGELLSTETSYKTSLESLKGFMEETKGNNVAEGSSGASKDAVRRIIDEELKTAGLAIDSVLFLSQQLCTFMTEEKYAQAYAAIGSSPTLYKRYGQAYDKICARMAASDSKTKACWAEVSKLAVQPVQRGPRYLLLFKEFQKSGDLILTAALISRLEEGLLGVNSAIGAGGSKGDASEKWWQKKAVAVTLGVGLGGLGTGLLMSQYIATLFAMSTLQIALWVAVGAIAVGALAYFSWSLLHPSKEQPMPMLGTAGGITPPGSPRPLVRISTASPQNLVQLAHQAHPSPRVEQTGSSGEIPRNPL